jgi:hypothetical protein
MPRAFAKAILSKRGSWIRSSSGGVAIAILLVGTGVAEEASQPKVQQALRNLQSAHGPVPTDLEFMRFMAAQPVKLNGTEMLLAWDELGRLQNPEITTRDLVELIKSKRASLQDMQQNYSVRREEFDGNGQVNMTLKRQYTFKFSGSKVLLEQHGATTGEEQNESDSFIKTYDGQLVRLVHDPKGKMPHASITQLESRNDFYRLSNVLVSSMLINSISDLGLPYGYYDLVHLIDKERSIVIEKTEKVDDVECVVVGGLACRVFLDPAHDYSVIRVEEYGVSNDKNDGFLGRFQTGLRELKRLKDYGNGVWLPSEVVQTVFSNGKPISRETTLLENAEINQGISDDVFSAIIPDGAMLADGIRGIVYRHGRSPSIEGTLWDAVSGEANPNRTILLLLNLVAIVVLLGFIWMRWRRKQMGLS